MLKECLVCKKEFNVPKTREHTAKYCSRPCSDKAPKKRNTVNCAECGKNFHLKKSQAERSKVWGSFCSTECNSNFRKRVTIGDGNPNFKGRHYDEDGYRIYSPPAELGLGLGAIKIHHAISFVCLGLTTLPKGYHVHHKDCDVLNNTESNLQLMSTNDHKWIHKEFGSATLWAIEKSLINIEDAVSWSSDQIRAEFLLRSNLKTQKDMLVGFDPKNEDHINERLTKNKVYFRELSETERGTGGFGSTNK